MIGDTRPKDTYRDPHWKATISAAWRKTVITHALGMDLPQYCAKSSIFFWIILQIFRYTYISYIIYGLT